MRYIPQLLITFVDKLMKIITKNNWQMPNDPAAYLIENQKFFEEAPEDWLLNLARPCPQAS
jgi:hypothetical protein